MRIVTANIKNRPPMRQSRVEHDVAKVKKRASVVLWQEINPGRYKHAVRYVGDGHWTTVHLGTANPISFDAEHFELLDQGVKLAHRGKAFASPKREITWVWLRRKSTGHEFVVLNTHFVSGAWNTKPKLHKAWRQRVWKVHFRVLRKMIRDFHEDGLTVFAGGDWNRTGMQHHFDEMTFLAAHGIIYLGYLEGFTGPKVQELATESIKMVFTDHPPQAASVALRTLRLPR